MKYNNYKIDSRAISDLKQCKEVCLELCKKKNTKGGVKISPDRLDEFFDCIEQYIVNLENKINDIRDAWNGNDPRAELIINRLLSEEAEYDSVVVGEDEVFEDEDFE